MNITWIQGKWVQTSWRSVTHVHVKRQLAMRVSTFLHITRIHFIVGYVVKVWNQNEIFWLIFVLRFSKSLNPTIRITITIFNNGTQGEWSTMLWPSSIISYSLDSFYIRLRDPSYCGKQGGGDLAKILSSSGSKSLWGIMAEMEHIAKSTEILQMWGHWPLLSVSASCVDGDITACASFCIAGRDRWGQGQAEKWTLEACHVKVMATKR